MQPRRLGDRRRDPVLPRRKHASTSSAARPRTTGCSTTRRRTATTSKMSGTSARPSTGEPQALPLPGTGSDGDGGAEKANGGPLPEIRFFNMGRLTIAGHEVRALHHGMSGVPGLRAVRAVGRRRGRSRRDRRGRRGARARAGRLARLRDEHARVGLDSLAAACRVYRRRDEARYRQWLPAQGLRGHRLARRQLLLGRHHRLLPDAVRPRLRAVREVRPRLHRARGARADGRAAARKKVTLAWNGDDVARAMGTLFQQGERAKYIDLPLSNYSTLPNDKV